VDFPDDSPILQLSVLNGESSQSRLRLTSNSIHSKLSTKQQLLGHPPHLWYSPRDAAKALQFLLASGDSLGDNQPYRSFSSLCVSLCRHLAKAVFLLTVSDLHGTSVWVKLLFYYFQCPACKKNKTTCINFGDVLQYLMVICVHLQCTFLR
jgi:hypothetical protein